MADQIVQASPGEPASNTDLVIQINPRWSSCHYDGTRAQLEAEGLIPADTLWPDGVHKTRWKIGVMSYQLSRAKRPDTNLRGLGWTKEDYWRVRATVDARCTDTFNMDIRERREALADAIYRASPAGRRQWERYLRTCEDRAFQAFKAKLLPEQKKRGRKPKSDASTQEAGHA